KTGVVRRDRNVARSRQSGTKARSLALNQGERGNFNSPQGAVHIQNGTHHPASQLQSSGLVRRRRSRSSQTKIISTCRDHDNLERLVVSEPTKMRSEFDNQLLAKPVAVFRHTEIEASHLGFDRYFYVHVTLPHVSVEPSSARTPVKDDIPFSIKCL